MFSVRARRQPYASGVVWPDTGNETPGGVKDVFGGRLFPDHVATTGYDYDFHRGVDMPLNEGDNYYSPINGHIIRVHRTHFEFNTTDYQNYWTTDNDGFGGSFSHGSPGLDVSGTRGGANSFGSVLKYVNKAPVLMTSNLWEMRLKLQTTTGINGALGFGMMDTKTSEYVTLEWDGTNVEARGSDSGGALTSHALTSAWTSSNVWLCVRSNGGNLEWRVSADGETWTDVWTEANPTWTNGSVPTFRAVVYYRSKDSNASPDLCSISYVGWYDDTTIDRFGNWVTVAGKDFRMLTLHLDDVAVNMGDFVSAGDVLGTVGLTGFDDRSGPIQTPHVHLEYIPDTLSTYSQDDAANPLAAGVLPRANVSNNVSVVISDANDPDAVMSHRMVVTVTRADQDFDINEFSLTGSTTSRTANWDTRAGLNADQDIPKQSGVYFVASSFDENSATYVITIYFNHSVVGATLVSAYVKDCNGTTVWSTP